MSTVDHTYHDFKCPKCGKTETCKILDKGNEYGASCWQCGADLQNFTVCWEGSGPREPRVVSAKCKTCGIEAEHTMRY